MNLTQTACERGVPYCEKVQPLFKRDGGEATVYECIPLSFFKENKMVPIEEDTEKVVMAVADPAQFELLELVGQAVKKKVSAALAPLAEVEKALQEVERREAGDAQKVIEDLQEEGSALNVSAGKEESADLLGQAGRGAVVAFVNHLLLEALEQRATDIHLQPEEKKARVYLRVDGLLHAWGEIPSQTLSAVVSRIKVMSRLDIAEKRLPQDGRCTVRVGSQEVDVRVSVVPTAFGERVALRLLNQSNLKLEALGFPREMETQFRSLLKVPHGIVLVTGPTGSGKTTTLYAALNLLQDGSRNILTVEDPVEYRLTGISQMQVKPEIGLTFAAGLRSLLRQDPDVILVGEIRDAETASVAVQAALTGHLVLATLHTNNAPGALTRLMELGVEPYLISSTVRGIVAQRLVRLVCSQCAGQGKSCASCLQSGYRGRTGIYELLVPNGAVQKCVQEKAEEALLWQACCQAGMRPLAEDGMQKARLGLTMCQEVLRVTSYNN